MTKIKYRPDLRWIILCAVALPFFSVKANENLEILKDSKKLVFLGDSITYGGEYVVLLKGGY